MNSGIVDRCADDLSQVANDLQEGDIVVIGVPTLSVPHVLEDCISKLSPEVTITDVASVKESVVNSAQELFGTVPPQFVPGHPIAGSEKSGVTAANAELFVNHRVILTLLEATADSHIERTSKLWQSVGAIVSSMEVENMIRFWRQPAIYRIFWRILWWIPGWNERKNRYISLCCRWLS